MPHDCVRRLKPTFSSPLIVRRLSPQARIRAKINNSSAPIIPGNIAPSVAKNDEKSI